MNNHDTRTTPIANSERASIGSPFSRYCFALQAASGPSYRPRVKLAVFICPEADIRNRLEQTGNAFNGLPLHAQPNPAGAAW